MSSKHKSKLFLIPSSLDDQYSGGQVAANAVEQIAHLKHFAVENLKHARRYLRKLLPELVIDECSFFEMGKHAGPREMERALATLRSGADVGMISEAGLPAVADPGNNLVSAAHENGIKVVPIIGPGSVFLALMASGMNGQTFTFHGYLPRENQGRIKRIKELEQSVGRTGYTQIFMETPYRNEQLLEDILKTCNPEMDLCIACDITTPSEFILTQKIKGWQQSNIKLHKRPAIFLLGRT